MIDTEKYQTLTALVREAKVKDKETLEAMEKANAEWKAANAILTDRIKVLKDWLTQCQDEDTAL
jgi:hypothetical protein